MAEPGRLNETSENPFVENVTATGSSLSLSIVTFNLMGLAKVYSDEKLPVDRLCESVCFG